MKEIQLTNGGVVLVDNEDFEKLNQYKWYAKKSGQGIYAVRCVRIGKRKDNKRRTIWMHRVIMNTPDGMEVHHKGENTLAPSSEGGFVGLLDNRKASLENCTKQANLGYKNHGY